MSDPIFFSNVFGTNPNPQTALDFVPVASIGVLENGEFRELHEFTWPNLFSDLKSPGYFFPESLNIVLTNNWLLAYNPSFGSAALYSLDLGNMQSGDFVGPTNRYFHDKDGLGGLKPAWTHIIPLNNFLLFYDAANGATVSTEIINGALQPSKEYIGLVPNWTHIAVSSERYVFYNTSNGSAAIAVIIDDKFQTLRGYEPGGPASGWTHLVNVGEFFYFITAQMELPRLP